jgi:putative spermidine/putrescine transport system substrate-binding protein
MSIGSVAARFQAATGCRVETESAGSGTELVDAAPISGADIYAISGEDLLALVSRGVADAVATNAVPGYSSVIGPLRNGDIASRGSLTYGVPFTWGPDEIFYNTADFTAPPASWATLYDPAHGDAVAMRDSPFTLATAALVLGSADPYALSPEDLAAAAGLAERQSAFVRAYWRAPDDLALLFADGQVSLAAGTGSEARVPIGAGIAGAVPDGVSTAWSDWWVLAASAQHPRCAYKWLAYTLSPDVQVALADVNGGSPASTDACALMTSEACSATHVQDDAFLSRMRFAHTPVAPTTLADWQVAWAQSR